jgi:hypothetical protein
MISNPNVNKLCTTLAGIFLVVSCGQPVPYELPVATSAPPEQVSPTSSPSIILPTEQVSPTPTDPSFVLPGGRVLFTAFAKAGGADMTDTYFEYTWLP